MSIQAPTKPKEDFAWAVKTGDLDRVKEFVEKENMNVNMSDGGVFERTPLHWAADFNQVEVMKYLVSKGAKVNAKDHYGITPLLSAVYENHLEAARFLIEKKADVSIKGPDGKTAKEAAEKEQIKALFK